MKQQPLINKDKYKLKIVKPDLNYLLANSETNNNNSQMHHHEQISSMKIPDDEVLMRVMAKQYFGRWYLDPSQWNKMQKKGFKQK